MNDRDRVAAAVVRLHERLTQLEQGGDGATPITVTLLKILLEEAVLISALVVEEKAA